MNEGTNMSTEARTILADMRASRRQEFAKLEGLSEERLTEPALWGRHEMDARFILLRYADHEKEHALQVRTTLDGFGWRQTEAQRILGTAKTTRSDLYGALGGLGDVDMDLAPAGDWPLRLTRWHIIQTERTCSVAIAWAADLFRQGREWEQQEKPAGHHVG